MLFSSDKGDDNLSIISSSREDLYDSIIKYGSELPFTLNPLAATFHKNSSFMIEQLNPRADPFIPNRNSEELDDISNNSILNVTGNMNEGNKDSNSAYQILQNLRVKCVNKIIIGHININSIRNKFLLLGDLIEKNVDILLVSETKLDSSFPEPQFILRGYCAPYRLDRTVKGGRLLLFIRKSILKHQSANGAFFKA